MRFESAMGLRKTKGTGGPPVKAATEFAAGATINGRVAQVRCQHGAKTEMAKRWQQLANDALAGVYPALERMSDSELRNLRSAVHKAMTTNCWWFVYGCMPTLSSAANDVLRLRYSNRRKAKAAAKKTPNAQVQAASEAARRSESPGTDGSAG